MPLTKSSWLFSTGHLEKMLYNSSGACLSPSCLLQTAAEKNYQPSSYLKEESKSWLSQMALEMFGSNYFFLSSFLHLYFGSYFVFPSVLSPGSVSQAWTSLLLQRSTPAVLNSLNSVMIRPREFLLQFEREKRKKKSLGKNVNCKH